MIKPNTSGIPGMTAMTDTLDFVKNLWGGMNIPGMGIPGIVMPTLSVDEINKQISDLKAVESWLTLNMNMLRGTIQALEVQSATISTLQSMGESFSAAVQTGADAVKQQGKPQAAPFVAPKPVVANAPASEAEPKAEPKIEHKVEAKPKIEAKDQSADFMAPQANPAVWWNMLQDQFKQAVNSAMVSEKAKPAAKSAPAAVQTKIAAKSREAAAPAKHKPAARKKAPKRARKA